jgi:tetratricopeptide (TPR) repeat protein
MIHAQALLGCVLLVLPLFAQEALIQARHALEAGRARDAVKILEAQRQQDPTQPEVYNLLGMAYDQLEDSHKAVAMFEEFARLAPNRPEALNNLGASYLRLGDAPKAEQAFRHALALRPSDPGTLYNLGALLNAQRQYAQARPLLEGALRSQRSPGIVYELAVAEAGTGDRKKALQTLDSGPPPGGPDGLPWLRLLGTLNLDENHLPEAASALERALTLAPNDQISLYSLGVARLKSHRPTEAVALLERSLDALPTSQRYLRVGALLADYAEDDAALAEFERAAQADPQSYDAFYNVAVLRLRKKDLSGAGQAGEHALTLQPTGEVHDLLGAVYEAQGRYKEAFEHYQSATRIAPDNEKFTFDLGVELIEHENYDAAGEIFQAATKRFPSSARIFLGLGTAAFLGGKTPEAVQAFLTATDLDSHDELAYTFLGEAYSFSGAYTPRVVEKLTQLAAHHPESFNAQYYYAAALVQEMEKSGDTGNAPRVMEVLRGAAALKPSNGLAYYQMGNVELLQKHVAEAAHLFEKCVALDPQFPDALYKLGRAYQKLGRSADAERLLALHHQVVTQQKAHLYRRYGEIQNFVLRVRNPN